MPSNVSAVFNTLRTTFEKKEALRESIRAKRDAADVIQRDLQRALATLPSSEDLKQSCDSIRKELARYGPALHAIQAVLPSEDENAAAAAFAQHGDLWVVQRQVAVSAAVLVEFIDGDRLPAIDDVRRLLGQPDVYLQIDDLLIGICNAISDLVRLCMNRVIRQDYRTPARCAVFASQVFDSFKELNFRNDFLRKRYDGVKYDVKRLEEIVYDLSVRGLLSASSEDVATPQPAQVAQPSTESDAKVAASAPESMQTE